MGCGGSRMCGGNPVLYEKGVIQRCCGGGDPDVCGGGVIEGCGDGYLGVLRSE